MSLKRATTSRVGTKKSATKKGVGGVTDVTVKHKRATAAQRRVIDGVLGEADHMGASRRVMAAAIMCITQESVAGLKPRNGIHIGPYHQAPSWGSYTERMDPAKSTHAFLTAWKRRHGSLKNAPGDLSLAIDKVQASGVPQGYAPWQHEAEQTVAIWQGKDGFGTSGGTTYIKRYEFTRGERKGARESSWDAMGRLAEEVGARRWAAGNILHYVSEDELRAGAASLEIHGDEGWLLAEPSWEWGSGRTVSELTLRVLADRWNIMPGGVVMVGTPGPTQGRWLVSSVSGARLDSPEADVTLKRPTRLRPEPAPETATTEVSGGASSTDLIAVCKHISSQDRPYRYGGGHGKPLSQITAHEGLDCSSSVSLALKRARMFKADSAMSSGQFATSWGKAGKGREFTVWANGTHVWIEFHTGSIKRFDTSRWGSGPSGPHTRTTARSDHARFTARHW